MIDHDQAREIAIGWITAHAPKPDGTLELCILDDRTRDHDFGWVFFYTSKPFRDTGDFQHTLAGNTPLIVDRRDGTLHTTGARPIEHYIEQYRRDRPV